VETRGEGIFVRLREPSLLAWLDRRRCGGAKTTSARPPALAPVPGISPPEAFFPGIRFVLLHSFAHALMREIALECGYSAASVRERIYASEPGSTGFHGRCADLHGGQDSEGTLGGLVSLGCRRCWAADRPDAGVDAPLLWDPLCSEHDPRRTTWPFMERPATRACSRRRPPVSAGTATWTRRVDGDIPGAAGAFFPVTDA